MKARVVEPWLLAPVEQFVRESGARLTLVMTPSGHVLAQYGFTRAVDVMSAAALGAGIAASTGEIVRMLDEPEFRALNHQSAQHGIFLGRFVSRRGPLLGLVVYGADTSIGLVQLFFEDLMVHIEEAAPAAAPNGPVLTADFERDLNENLATLFR